MTLETLVALAKQNSASDLHVESGMPVALRVRGTLHLTGQPISSRSALNMVKKLLNQEQWSSFMERRSHDFSKTIEGVRCRINVLQSSRGVGMAIRLLSSFEATLERLNLHPDIRLLLEQKHGLILVCGPTGSGKSTTIAALVEELNVREPLHIVTLENPIEYSLRPKRALIRQREVGRDTPSFEQALLDAMREDPDVLVVGEMRHPETMRLTLNAAETGHLVISTLHSSTAAEALQRLVAAFPSEIQSNVCSQLADCLVGVVCQRLVFREDVEMRVPECEILMANQGVRAMIRQGYFSRLPTAIETGGKDGMWTFERYRRWLDERTDWVFSDNLPKTYHTDDSHVEEPQPLPPLSVNSGPSGSQPRKSHRTIAKKTAPSEPSDNGILVLDQEEDLEDIISALKKF